MESKYYTPSIEEFFVGFECEKYNDSITQWEPYIVSEYSWQHNGMWKELKFNSLLYRVKHLDREDIESLGFNLYKIHAGTTLHEFEKIIGKEERLLSFDPNFSKYWNITITDAKDPEFTYFHGYIKNKSELKVLLKQLGIE